MKQNDLVARALDILCEIKDYEGNVLSVKTAAQIQDWINELAEVSDGKEEED